MAILKVNISSELEKRFRETAMKKYGYVRGALSLAAQKALEHWTYEEFSREKAKEIAKKHTKDPVDEIEGLLSHVKGKTSVELQHEAGRYRTEMALSYLKKRK
ncbi:MAG: hypothetical protein HYW24_02300 [Candidatus Aenigmarchaeota archaeon]|nr:hypothetical protein [Candidatus Aenigmarchaeota archaeon]